MNRPRQVEAIRENGYRRCPSTDADGHRCGSYLTSETDDRGTLWTCKTCDADAWFACELCDRVVPDGGLRRVPTTLVLGRAWCCEACEDAEAALLFQERSAAWFRAVAEDKAAREELPFGRTSE